MVDPFCKMVVAVNTNEAVLVNVDELITEPAFRLKVPLLLKEILLVIEPVVVFVTTPVALFVNVPLLKFSRSAAVLLMLNVALLVSVPPWKRKSPLVQLIVRLLVSISSNRTSPVTLMVIAMAGLPAAMVVGTSKLPLFQAKDPLTVSEPEPAMAPPAKLIVIVEMTFNARLKLAVPPDCTNPPVPVHDVPVLKCIVLELKSAVETPPKAIEPV